MIVKVHKIRELSHKELIEKLDEKMEEVANLKFQHALHQLENTDKVRIAKRELARMKTILLEHETGIRKLRDAETIDEEL